MTKKFEKFTHGIMVIDPENLNEDGSIPVYHFVGYWEEPNENAVMDVYEELRSDEEFGLTEKIDELEIVPATQEVIEYFNTYIHNHEENN